MYLFLTYKFVVNCFSHWKCIVTSALQFVNLSSVGSKQKTFNLTLTGVLIRQFQLQDVVHCGFFDD